MYGTDGREQAGYDGERGADNRKNQKKEGKGNAVPAVRCFLTSPSAFVCHCLCGWAWPLASSFSLHRDSIYTSNSFPPCSVFHFTRYSALGKKLCIVVVFFCRLWGLASSFSSSFFFFFLGAGVGEWVVVSFPSPAFASFFFPKKACKVCVFSSSSSLIGVAQSSPS